MLPSGYRSLATMVLKLETNVPTFWHRSTLAYAHEAEDITEAQDGCKAAREPVLENQWESTCRTPRTAREPSVCVTPQKKPVPAVLVLRGHSITLAKEASMSPTAVFLSSPCDLPDVKRKRSLRRTSETGREGYGLEEKQ